MLGCADADLIGKTLHHNEIVFTVNESFYKDQAVNPTQMAELFENADSINLVGKKTVNIALQNNWVKKEDIIQIGTVPHAQVFKL